MGAIRATAVGLMIFITAVASAADCLTEGRVISTRASVPNLVNGGVAWSGIVLAVAKTQENALGALWVGIYDEDFNQLFADRQLATDAREVVATLWTGAEFGVFYRTLTQGMNLQRLTMTGEPIGAPIPVTPTRTVYVADEIDVVWSPAIDGYVVARAISQGRDEGLWITVLNEDGTQRTDRLAPVNIAQQSELDLTVSDSGVIGAFYINVNGSLAFVRTGVDGLINARTLATAGGTNLEAAAQGSLFVVTRALINTDTDQTEIRWLIVDSTQQIVRPDAVLLKPSANDDEVLPLALLSTEDALALAYVDVPRREQRLEQEYRLRRFRIDGSTISDTPFAATNVSFARGVASWPFVWTGRSYVSAPVRVGTDRLNSYLLRFCPLRLDIVSPDELLVRVGDPVVFTGNATGGVPNYTYSWLFPNEIGPKSGQTLERTFTRAGTYTVLLTVTDQTGATVTQEITVTAGKPKQRAARR
jgi:PKD domain